MGHSARECFFSTEVLNSNIVTYVMTNIASKITFSNKPGRRFTWTIFSRAVSLGLIQSILPSV